MTARRVAALAAGLLVLLLLVIWAPTWLVSVGPKPSTKDKWMAAASARSAMVQLVVGVGALVGGVYAARTFSLTRRQQYNDRFSMAVGHLGDQSTSVRIGGIHTLRLLSEEQVRFWDVADDLLSALIRERLEDRMNPSTATFEDVQAALLVLGQRVRHRGNPLPKTLNFSGLDLDGFSLVGGDFHRVDLSGASMRDAQMNDVRLTEADLRRLKSAEGADLSGANLRKADAREASWQAAGMFNARIQAMNCEGAHMDQLKNLSQSQIASIVGTPAQAPIADQH